MFSVKYHNLFDYKLIKSDFPKWQYKDELIINNLKLTIDKKRYQRKIISEKKLLIARKASKILSLILTVKMIGITGSLAMQNSTEDSDIDLMIVTKKGTLWLSRLLSYFVLCTMHYVLRRPNDRNQRDALCLNMWLDESDLIWKKSDRNIYTAHEIAQIVPLVNKDKTYEKFLYQNKWILDFRNKRHNIL